MIEDRSEKLKISLPFISWIFEPAVIPAPAAGPFGVTIKMVGKVLQVMFAWREQSRCENGKCRVLGTTDTDITPQGASALDDDAIH